MQNEIQRGVIRLGDHTTRGCAVVQVTAGQFAVLGRPVARVGDLCKCAQPGGTICRIIEGDSQHTVHGLPVAYHGHKTSCGATLISTAAAFTST